MKILFVGCGDLAAHTINALATHAEASAIQLYGLRRTISNLPRTLLPIIPIAADLSDLQSLTILNTHKFDLIVVTLTPDVYTEAGYLSAYYQNLKHLLRALKRHTAPNRLFWVSSTRVYGEDHTGVLDERIIPIPSDYRGEILFRAENLLQTVSFPTTILRLTGIYGEKRPSIIATAQIPQRSIKTQFSNRIHIQDAGSFIAHLIGYTRIRPPAPLYIVTDDQPTPFCQIIDWVQAKLNIQVESNTETDLIIERQLLENHSRRFSNALAKSTGWMPAYPSFREGLNNLFP